MKQRCNITFEFDKQDRKYQAGDTVTGQVVIKALKDLSIQAVHMHLSWQGSVNDKVYKSDKAIRLSSQDKTNHNKLELSETELLAGSTYKVPFAFEAPLGPLSYKGENLVMDWFLHANIDLPKELALTEPKWHKKIWIAAKEGQAIYLGPSYNKAPKIASFLEGGNPFYSIFTVLITGGILWFISSGSNPFQTRADTITFWVILIVGALIALWQVANYFNDQELAKKFKQLDFKLNQQVMPGQAINYKFVLEAKQDTTVKRLAVQLKGFEFVGGSRDNRNSFREVIHEQKLELAENAVIPKNTVFEKIGEIIIPKSAPCTFITQKGGSEASVIRINYELKFELMLEGGTNKYQTYQIDVVPSLHDKIDVAKIEAKDSSTAPNTQA